MPSVMHVEELACNVTGERTPGFRVGEHSVAYVQISELDTAIGTAVFEVKMRVGDRADGPYVSFPENVTHSITGAGLIGPVDVTAVSWIAVEVTTLEGTAENVAVDFRAEVPSE